MARVKPVELATQSFANQTEATTFFKALLHRYKPGKRVSEEDATHLFALLERHTEYAAKVGCGVSHFEVMTAEQGTQCFKIVRTDGTGTDFSYRHCITQQPPSRKQEVSHAFRRVVRFDLYRALEKFHKEHAGVDGLVSCAVTQERVAPEQGHMDHRPPMTFEVIVTTFLASRGLSLDAVPLTVGQDDQTAPDVTDPALSEAFLAYHNHVARLDFVKSTVNLAQASRNRIKPTRIVLGGAAL